MADGDDVLVNLMSITGADEETALNLLSATDFKLEEAVNLFFATDGGQGIGSGAGGGAGGSGRGGSADIPAAMDEDEVRAPLPTKVERLYGDHFNPHSMMTSRATQYGLQQQRAAPQVDVFRDFKAEGSGAAQSSNAGLSDLFKVPQDLLCGETIFEGAKMLAAHDGKWMLVNVQSASEFASHRLNRDTWSHEALKEMIKGMFVFFQTHNDQPEGLKLVSAYKLDITNLPAILIVDPITGEPMHDAPSAMHHALEGRP